MTRTYTVTVRFSGVQAADRFDAMDALGERLELLGFTDGEFDVSTAEKEDDQ